jgi:hypothetical protein
MGRKKNTVLQGGGYESANWTEARTAHLVAACLGETVKGATTSNGYKSAEWTAITATFNAAAGVIYSRDHLQLQYKQYF